ncbi:LLM class flavin-dependent oxidoreductase [Pseudonocardia xishanensis]|uniref:LLM class flavin-dependent oxidoreductase n=1 Tax=Pseudonocardia xishanensis TaxID=630995 RepID=UPI0031EF9BD2
MGSGEALNEHVLGDAWPSVGQRLAMLEEAVDLIRLLHRGEQISHHGEFYEVQEARISTLPERPVPIHVSGFGPQATALAGRIGDGCCTVQPDAELVRTFRENGGGDDPEAHLERVRSYLDAGVDEVDVQQVGADHEGFFRAWGEQILPKLR